MSEEFDWATAVHEAGHAVIGRVLNMVCGNVSIIEDGDSAGLDIPLDSLRPRQSS